MEQYVRHKPDLDQQWQWLVLDDQGRCCGESGCWYSNAGATRWHTGSLGARSLPSLLVRHPCLFCQLLHPKGKQA